ncbi:unnamed protein product [Brachionus calyciflorus]|uniref:Uncharacterized protein n=1 Tax=Brachionus calyciflorus TaxID=104777 RepID=A0A813MDL2_9BILA|nr:unnamed protein product [Brachionus calyciflorus]
MSEAIQFELKENLVPAKYAQRLKKSISLLSGIVTTLTLFVIVLVVFVARKSPSIEKNKICLSHACVKAANMVIENMNFSVDPCEDFYEFTCGSFVKKTVLAENQRISTFDRIENQLGQSLSDLLTQSDSESDIEPIKNAKKFLRSCLNESNIEKNGDAKLMRFIIKEFDGWPLFDPIFFRNETQHAYKNLAALYKYGIFFLFDLYVNPSISNPTIPTFKIYQPSWFLDKSYYEKEEKMNSYKNFIAKILRLYNSSNSDLTDDIDKMVELEKKLAMNLLNTAEKRIMAYEKMTIGSLKKNFSEFDWETFIQKKVFKEIGNISIGDNQEVELFSFRYVSNAIKIFTEELKKDKKNLDNLLIWSFVKKSLHFLPKAYSGLTPKLAKMFPELERFTNERLLECIYSVTEQMEYAVGRLYVENFFNHDSKKASFEMIKNIQNEFKIMLNEYDWMDRVSRKAALEKADSIDIKVGFPEFIFNDTYLIEMYQEYKMSEVEFFENTYLINRILIEDNLKQILKKVERKVWQMGPAIVNAFYNPQSNQICFPAGILQAPFYDSKSPNYLNYGGIGAVIGHEITHGFDDRGRKFDKDGIFHSDDSGSLWSNKAVENYKNKAQCIIDQYSNFLVKQINKRLNGNQTQGENIADNGGLKESYRAYKRWEEKNGKEPLLPGLNFNQDQLFFINYGQIWCGKYKSSYLEKAVSKGLHSVGDFRVRGTTMNMEAFSKAFNCKPGQQNNPIKKCSIW